MQTGISVYMGSDERLTERTVAKAAEAGITWVFSSLQIPEEASSEARSRALRIMRLCREASLKMMVDVSPRTLDMLGIPSLEGLRDLGVECVRLDYGFSDLETVELSRTYHIALNASTVSVNQLRAWERLGADLSRFVACHNYYPKPLTGLPLSSVGETNRRFRFFGIETMAFVPGDATLRGPLGEGLPTVEVHRARRQDVVLNALELARGAATDIVAVGDPGLSDAAWRDWALLARDLVPIHVELDPSCEFLRGSAHHDRMDSSDRVFRSRESREQGSLAHRLERMACSLTGNPATPRTRGDIVLSLEAFGRYAGELEIMRQDAPADERCAVIGRVCEADLKILDLATQGMGVCFR